MSETIEELAARKVRLKSRLNAMQYMNVYGRTNEELISMEIENINTRKELNEVQAKIESFVEAV